MVSSGVAIVFPGQGSQFVGMGRDLATEFRIVADTLDEASEVLGSDLKTLCFDGPEESLKRTSNTQPAILALSIGIWRVLEGRLLPMGMAGHSLGEYSALVASGALQFADAIRLVRRRGLLMETAVLPGEGGMCAVLGLELPEVQRACEMAKHLGLVAPANINCPGQIVISGTAQALAEAAAQAKVLGAKRTVMLNVSGPFHSPLMQRAAEEFAADLEEVSIGDPAVPIISNVTGEAVRTGDEIRSLLLEQMTHPVLWQACVDTLVGMGATRFVEVGPGRVVSGLVRKISKTSVSIPAGELLSLKELLEEIGEVS